MERRTVTCKTELRDRLAVCKEYSASGKPYGLSRARTLTPGQLGKSREIHANELRDRSRRIGALVEIETPGEFVWSARPLAG